VSTSGMHIDSKSPETWVGSGPAVPLSPPPVSELTTPTKGETEMGKIVVSENVSLDGVIEDPAGVEGFRLGGWFFETDRGEDGEKFTLDKALGTEALLLGRRSYEFFAATWPSRGGELADKLNSLPKYVVS
jgi:hypothetical protein